MNMTTQTIKSIAEAAAVSVLTTLGMTSGEISRSRAMAVYGKWFKDAEAAGRLRPVRVGTGKTGTRWFSIMEILALRAEDERAAELQLESVK